MKKHLLYLFLFVTFSASFSAKSQTTYIFQENFASITSGDNTTSTGSGTAWSGNTNFPTVDRAFQAGGMVKLGSSSAIGSLTSKTLDLSANGGNFKISFKVKGWTSIEGSIKVSVTGLTPQTVTYTALQGSTSPDLKTLSFTGGTANSTIKIETTARRAYIDDVEIYYENVPTSPSITAPGSLAFGNQTVNTVSTAFSLALAYSNLDGTAVNLTIADPFTISKTTNGSYSNSLTFTAAELNASNSTIYAKYSPTANSASLTNLSITGGGIASAVTVQFSGNGTIGDLSPPLNTLNFPKTSSITLNSVNLTTNINEDGTSYYILIPASGVAPTTSAQIKAGMDGNGNLAIKSGSFANTPSADALATIAGLTGNTAYSLYVVAEDNSANLQTSFVVLNFNTLSSPAVTAPIIISQYYEGGGTNKWIELTNLSGTDVNTATPQLKLALYNISGDAGNIAITATPSQTMNLNITIPAHGTVLIGNSGNLAEVPYLTAASAVQTNNSVINFNGNDGIALLDASNNIIDAFGQGLNAKDVSYIRNLSVTEPTATFNVADWQLLTLAVVQNAIDGDDADQLGVHLPLNLPACASPTIPATALTFQNTTTGSISGSFTKSTDANEYLIVRSLANTLSSTPVDGVTYIAGAALGGGTIISKTATNIFTDNGLTSSTSYYYFVFPLNNSSCTGGPKYMVTNVLTASETTRTLLPCATPSAQATAFNIVNSNYNFVQANFTLANGVDEYLVVMSTSNSLSALPNNQAIYAVGDAIGGGTVIKLGIGNSFTKNGLSQNTDYYFFVFSVNSSCSGGPLYLTTAPLTGHYKTGILDVNNLNFYFGNLHSHSSDSDGNKDNTNKTPADDYAFAKTALNFDFLGLSEHNHSQAGMTLSKWQPGINAARNATTSTFLALHGMEWGVISGGGHVIVYGLDSLVGWESGNNQIYVPKSVYLGSTGLFRVINRHGLNAFATLAHPSSSDYNNVAGTYDLGADSAIVGSALASGPAFSTNVNYSDAGSSMSYLSYYNKMLAKGYHLGATIDHDNHNLTFGKHTRARMVVLAPALTENDLLDAIKKMRFYASEDSAARVTFKINDQPIGSIFKNSGAPIISLTSQTTNPVTSIKLFYGVPGSGANPTEIANSTTGTLNFSHSALANMATGYYYVDLTEDNGLRVITSPIWYTRDDALPIKLTSFSAKSLGSYVSLRWTTASETNNHFFTIERSTDGRVFIPLKQVKGAGNSSSITNYSAVDENPVPGTSYYRIKQTDFNDDFSYSKIEWVNVLTAKEDVFTVYPNPVTTRINFSFPTTSNSVNLIVSGIDGKILFNETNSMERLSEKVNSKLSNFSAGVYILKLTTNGQVYSNKFIKQ